MNWKLSRTATGNPARRALLFAALAATCAISLYAQAPAAAPSPADQGDAPPSGFAKIINLYPGPTPDAKGSGPADTPKLYFYPPRAASAHAAVIVLPGGGYNHLVMEKEGGVAARWLAAKGVAAFVLQYRISPYRFPVPMNDGQRAIRYIRSHAAEFDIEPGKIGVWGFSAGGQLAGFLSTAPDEKSPADAGDPADKADKADKTDQASAHPDFAILSYARLSMDPAIPRPDNLEPLVGDHPTPETLDRISIDKHVTAHTSPAFIYSTSGDQTVNSLNATAYYNALKRAGVPAELHIFELGPHGTGMGQNLPGLTELAIWPLLLEQWMQQHNWMVLPNFDR